MFTTVQVKPLSTNSLFQGRRYRTSAYDDYEKEVSYQLPPQIVMPTGKLFVRYVVGLSNRNADMANIEKAFTDILQKKYLFNDKNIYKLEMERVDTKKGEEFVSFEILPYDP